MTQINKKVGRLKVNFYDKGWPRWTHFEFDDRELTCVGLDEEEVRELHFHLGRIIAQLDTPRT